MTLFFDVENLGYAHLFLFVYMNVCSCSHTHTHTHAHAHAHGNNVFSQHCAFRWKSGIMLLISEQHERFFEIKVFLKTLVHVFIDAFFSSFI